MIHDKNSQLDFWCEVSKTNPRPYIPLEFRKHIFDDFHKLSHSGSKSSKKVLQQIYFWPRMASDINKWVRTCLSCQTSKVTRHTKSEFQQFAPENERFKHIHMDLVGPLPPSKGFSYILTTVDRFTRWPEAIPIPDMKTTTIVKAFIDNYVSRFGVPLEITTDQGRQLESDLFSEFNNLLGSFRIRTTAYHSQSNGLVERFHRTLKASLLARQNATNWVDELPFILLGIRTAIKTDIGCSSADLVYGQSLRIPSQLVVEDSNSDRNIGNSDNTTTFVQNLRKAMSNVKSVNSRVRIQDDIFIPSDLHDCKFVLLRKDNVRVGLTPPYEGPYEVMKRLRKQFVINVKGKNVSVLDRLKPALISKV